MTPKHTRHEYERKRKHEDGKATHYPILPEMKGFIKESGVVPITELPGRRRGKGEVLARLPELLEVKDRLRAGLSPGEAAYLKIDAKRVKELNITTSRRIIRDLLAGFIRDEKLTTKDGNRLDVLNYKADDGGEVIYVADAVDLRRIVHPRKKKGAGEKPAP